MEVEKLTEQINLTFKDYQSLINNWNEVLKTEGDYRRLYPLFVHLNTYKGFKQTNQIHSDLRYKYKYNFAFCENTTYFKSSKFLHPLLNISSIGLNNVLKYLEHTKELHLLNEIDREIIYTHLLDSVPPQSRDLNYSGNIYNKLYLYKKIIEIWYNTPYGNTLLKDLFTPCLNGDWVNQLITYDNTNYTTRYNRYNESLILSQISRIKLIDKTPFEESKFVISYQERNNIILTEEQIKTIILCVENPFSLIQGSGGTGKSTISTCIANILTNKSESVLFLTISHKAKSVVEDNLLFNYVGVLKPITRTIASFLISPNEYDNIIIDEASMVGNEPFAKILTYVKKRIICIGDSKQILPVCSIGTPFTSLQSFMNVCELSVIKRQNDNSNMKDFINGVIHKNLIKLEEYTNQEEGVYFCSTDFIDLACEFYKTLNPSNEEILKGESIKKNFCCIKPSKVDIQNGLIQERLNPNKPPIVKNKWVKFYEYDYVVRTSNLKCEGNIEFSNGMFGYVIENDNESVNVIYSKDIIETITKKAFLYNFALAYTQTAHKFQGSECDNVLLNIKEDYMLCGYNIIGKKNLLYTAITRAKKRMIICGTEKDKSILTRVINEDFFIPVHTIDSIYNGREVSLYINYNIIPNIDLSPNKDSIMEIVAEPIKHNCKCGSSITNNPKSIQSHYLTKKHLNWVENN